MGVPACWTDATMTLPDGRKLGYAGFGATDGPTVFHFHGALTSRWEGFWLSEGAKANGLRLISVDRPGIGNSCLSPERRIADWPKDVAALADHLGLATFDIVGVSGGGPYALACAALLPQRVGRVALIAGAGPLAEPAAYALLTARQRVTIGTMIHNRGLLRAFLLTLRMMPDMLRVLTIGAALGGLNKADLAILRKPETFAAHSTLPPESRMAPFGADCHGPAWDGHLHSQPWGFELESIRTPVDLWYADDDRVVPARFGRYLASRLPVNEARFIPEDGHISLILGRAAEYLKPLAKTIPLAVVA